MVAGSTLSIVAQSLWKRLALYVNIAPSLTFLKRYVRLHCSRGLLFVLEMDYYCDGDIGYSLFYHYVHIWGILLQYAMASYIRKNKETE